MWFITTYLYLFISVYICSYLYSLCSKIPVSCFLFPVFQFGLACVQCSCPCPVSLVFFIWWFPLPVFVRSGILFMFGHSVVFIVGLISWYWHCFRALAYDSLALWFCTVTYLITWISTSACLTTISALSQFNFFTSLCIWVPSFTSPFTIRNRLRKRKIRQVSRENGEGRAHPPSALTNVGPAQRVAPGPGPHVLSPAVDADGLDAAVETPVDARGPRQPIHAGGPSDEKGCAERDLGVLALNLTGTVKGTWVKCAHLGPIRFGFKYFSMLCF